MVGRLMMLQEHQEAYDRDLRTATPGRLHLARLLQRAAGTAPNFPVMFQPAPVYLRQAMTIAGDRGMSSMVVKAMGATLLENCPAE